ncbi:MAG: sodium/proline symporter [Candidatus Dependentiae bacterium]|nr:sodium/proline symporter [Candidatus Dependentiae bacterium]
MNIAMLSAFILYFCTLIGIALYFYKKNSSAQNFMLGDRSVNYWVTAIATQATDMGSWLFMGLPAAVYISGLFEAWTAIGLVIGMFLTWHFIAPKLRIDTGSRESVTLPSYFAHRFGDTSGALQFTGAFFCLFFSIPYIASGVVGLSLLFESTLGISHQLGIALSLSTAVLYTLIGGFVAIAWCDMFQGIFLLCMILLVPIYAFIHIPNGIADIFSAAQAGNKTLSLISSPADTISAILLAAGWGLGYFGQPHILMNFMGIDDPQKIKYAKWVGITWQILVLTSSVSVGLMGIGFFGNTLNNPQLVFIRLVTELFHPFCAGFILCAILAATLSTIDSLILGSGATIATDLYKTFINPAASSDQTLRISRIGSLLVSGLALYIAWENTLSIHNLVNYAWAGLGSSFGPLVILSLYSKNTTKTGALTGMIAGGLTSALWPYAVPLVPGFCIGMATIYCVSLLSRPS